MLKKPEYKKIFLDKFNTHRDQCLTYFNFYELLFTTLKLDIPKWEWEFIYEDLEFYLDSDDTADMSLNDVANWLKMYDFDLGVLTHASTEQIRKKDIHDDPYTYKHSKEDYFRGLKTILNSELAAIAMCENLYQKCKEQRQMFWEDPDFGPTATDPTGALSVYYEGETPPSHPDVDEIKWLTPEEYLKDETDPSSNPNPVFVKNDSSTNEVLQGTLGNCWFISALSVLAGNDELIRGGSDSIDTENINIIDKSAATMASMGVFPPIFHKFRKRGIYCFRFFKDFNWRYVIIDKKLPTVDYQLVFAKCLDEEELWVPLIEKAYAKLFGCYEALRSGNINDGLVDMTGFACENKSLHDRAHNFNLDKDTLWE